MKAVSELLVGIEDLSTEKERVAFLQSIKPPHQKAVMMILKGMFDPTVKFRLPEGKPPYEDSKDDNPGQLMAEIGRLYIFVEGGHPTVTDKRLQYLFQQILSTLIPSDADLLVAMKDKKSPYKGLNRQVVKKAFPGLIS